MPSVHGQQVVRTVTVTAYVTLVQTVAMPIPVTYYVTVASVTTSFMTLTTTAVSVSLGTVTLWNTITSVRTGMGLFGPVPSTLFGAYGDAGIMGVGAVAGAALTLLFARHSGKPRKGGLSGLWARAVDALDEQDERNRDLLNQVVTAADATAEANGNIDIAGQEADLGGTGGVALIEFAKDSMQTAVSNISSAGTNESAVRKIAERKMADDARDTGDEGKEEEGDDESEGS